MHVKLAEHLGQEKALIDSVRLYILLDDAFYFIEKRARANHRADNELCTFISSVLFA